jgi:hypothetical protein
MNQTCHTDNQGKGKSDPGNDKKLNREKNNVTGIRTDDQPHKDKTKDDRKRPEEQTKSS